MKYLALIIALSLTGCESLNSFFASPTGKVVQQLALNAASTYARGGNLDQSWAVSQGLFAISASVPIGEPGATIIRDTVMEYAGTNDVDTRALAKKLVDAYLAANPLTPKASKDTVNALATGVNNGTAIVSGKRHD